MCTKNSFLLKEAEMNFRAKFAVLEGADWLTAAQVGALCGLARTNLDEWRNARAVFAIRSNGIDYFPGYAFDPEKNYSPYQSVKIVISHLGAASDGWGLAFWFHSINSFLGGKRPMDVLAKQSNAVIAAAADASIGVEHA